jgi:hypothetical protein
MPSMTSPFRSRFWLLLMPSRRSRLSAVSVLLPFGDACPVGVLVVEGVSAGCEKSPNSECTRGADEVGAYEVCEVSKGGRLEGSLTSEALSVKTPLCMGSATACLRGLKVDMLEFSAGL